MVSHDYDRNIIVSRGGTTYDRDPDDSYGR